MRPAASASSRSRCWSALPQFQREELLAALLTFRALYFVLPLLLATLSLGCAGTLSAGTPGRPRRRDHGA